MEKAALFDLDGVLIDTEPAYTKCWEAIDRAYPRGVENFAMKIKGSTLQQILSSYFPDLNERPGVMQMLDRFETEMKYEPFPEAIRFVEELNTAGIKCAIVTSSSKEKMEKLYAQNPGFCQRFCAVITGDMVSKSKPAPEPYLKGAEALGVEIGNCYVFEDSLSGIESGNRAGATVVGIASTLPIERIKGKVGKAIAGFSGFHISDLPPINKP